MRVVLRPRRAIVPAPHPQHQSDRERGGAAGEQPPARSLVDQVRGDEHRAAAGHCTGKGGPRRSGAESTAMIGSGSAVPPTVSPSTAAWAGRRRPERPALPSAGADGRRRAQVVGRPSRRASSRRDRCRSASRPSPARRACFFSPDEVGLARREHELARVMSTCPPPKLPARTAPSAPSDDLAGVVRSRAACRCWSCAQGQVRERTSRRRFLIVNVASAGFSAGSPSARPSSMRVPVALRWRAHRRPTFEPSRAASERARSSHRW